MIERLADYLTDHREEIYLLLRRVLGLDKVFLLHSDLWDTFQAFCDARPDASRLCDSPLAKAIRATQEATIEGPWIYFAVRPRVARWHYLRFHIETVQFSEISVDEYLQQKERAVLGAATSDDRHVLEIDLGPFGREFPKLKESRSIGRGVEFLNRSLASRLFQELGKGDRRLLKFLQVHQYEGSQLMLNDRIRDVDHLQRSVRRAEDYLAAQPQDAPWSSVAHEMRVLGFEPGWGATVRRVRETLDLLSDMLEAPDPKNLELFLRRIPMIFNLLILSPHGYFGQSNVLGLPDSGGQIVYILDQVRALEKEMCQRVAEQGLDIQPQILVVTRLIPEARGTSCNQRLEPIMGTENARILRVPFRNAVGETVPHWISRFNIWPYLERFSFDVEREVLAELGGKPDLIVGNYSDGNLLASLLSQRLQVTQCNIAHALEKAKYLFSDLYWRDNDEQYHFACQYTADLISMNAADFIITSTYQEIAGTESSVGQYESYTAFTLPELYRVVNGIDMFDPKFNIVSPGADADVYYPYTRSAHRLTGLREELGQLVFGEEPRPDARGVLQDRDNPLLFTMARLDRIKNITGLVEWYGRNEALRRLTNLVVVAGQVDASGSDDEEERAQIEHMHRLMDDYGLDGQVRWLGVQLEKNLAGELYRYIADHRGAFVQPALFEAFGLTVIEAMASGLPTFATLYGGPLEIIEHGKSGFHIDPNHGEAAAQIIADFYTRLADEPDYWNRISAGALQRVESRYTWTLYAERMMTLSRIYGFWKYVTNLERAETRRYLEMLYSLQYRPLAEAVPH